MERFADLALRAAGAAALALGWRPHEFWGATPAELVTALGGPGEMPNGVGADDLAALQERFPDG